MGVDEIITKKLTRSEILAMKDRKEINEIEFLLLFSLDNDDFFKKILKGVGEYKIKLDTSVPEDLYFTDVNRLLMAFYSLYQKLPEYHFDQLLEVGLEKLSASRFDLYEFLEILNRHLENEKNNRAPFKIESRELLLKAKQYLKDPNYREIVRRMQTYTAKGRTDGMLDVYRDYNKNFIEVGGVDILAQDEPTPSVKF